MSGHIREYRVDTDRHSEHTEHSELADIGPSHGTGSGGSGSDPSAPTAPASNQSMIELLGRSEEGVDPERDADERVELDEDLLADATGTLQTSWGDFVVTDADARHTLSVLQAADPEQQGLMVQAMRDSGDLDVLLEQLPAEDLENLSGTLGAYITSDRVTDVMENLFASNGEVDGAVDLIVALPPEQQAASLLEMSDSDFAFFVARLPPDRRSEMADAMGAMADPERRLALWGAVAQGQAQDAYDDSIEEAPGMFDWSDEANATRHRNSQRQAILSSSQAEIAEEMAHLQEELAAGNATIDDVLLLERRKAMESRLEQDYGVNLTNETGESMFSPAERRVWTETELAAMEGALSRMPPEHVRDNTALTEIRRVDGKRSSMFSEINKGVGADAGSGLIRFYDTGTDYDAGANGAGDPWRTETESDLSGHDGAQTGSDGATHLIQEVLSHELGHTVHQGDDQLEQDFHDLSRWETLGSAGIFGESARQRMIANGMTPEEADAEIAQLEATRDDFYGSRHQVEAGDDLIMVDPYGGGYRVVDRDAIPGRDEAVDRDGDGSVDYDWGYAETNPSDHFAELYTKAVHAPESLYRDLIQEPQAQVDQLTGHIEASRQALEADRENLSEDDIRALEEDIVAQEDALRRAEETARMRESQHTFMRERVFETDDSDIQALEAPAGKEDVYAEYQALAAQCMTPQQLDALRERYADRL